MNFKIRLTTNRSLSSFHNFFQLSETAFYSQNFNLLILCSQKRAKLTKLSRTKKRPIPKRARTISWRVNQCFPCLGQFPRNCSISGRRRPNFARPIFQNGRPFVASRARLTVSLSRAAAYSPRIYFRSLELVEGQ